MDTLTTAASETRIWKVVTTETEALTVRFRGNEYARGSCIGKQKNEGFQKVFSLRSAKD
jgi:hypothetical protein